MAETRIWSQLDSGYLLGRRLGGNLSVTSSNHTNVHATNGWVRLTIGKMAFAFKHITSGKNYDGKD